MSNPETVPRGLEKALDAHELESINHERREALRDSLEKAEHEHKSATKESLSEVKAEAIDKAKPSTPSTIEQSPREQGRTLFTKRHREESFNKQMESIQPHLSPSEQKFSNVIHNKIIEKTSDTIGDTIARPNALLAGSISAFVLVTIVYLLAKHYGYQLSGFETIGAFVIGWVAGLLYDYVRLLVKGKK